MKRDRVLARGTIEEVEEFEARARRTDRCYQMFRSGLVRDVGDGGAGAERQDDGGNHADDDQANTAQKGNLPRVAKLGHGTRWTRNELGAQPPEAGSNIDAAHRATRTRDARHGKKILLHHDKALVTLNEIAIQLFV